MARAGPGWATRGPPVPSLVTHDTMMTLSIAGGLSAAVAFALWYKGVLRPEGLGAGKGARDVSGVPAAVWFVCGSMIFLTPYVMLNAVAALPPDVRGAKGSLQADGLALLLTLGGATIMGALMVYLVSARGGEKAGLRPRGSDVWIGLGCLMLLVPFYFLLTQGSMWLWEVWTGRSPARVAHTTLERIISGRDDPWAWVVILSVVVLTPIVEELVYRVFLQSCLLRLIGSPWASVFIAAVLFTAVHIGSASDHALPWLFVLALGMGVAYEKTRRLGVPIVMHAGFNGAMVALAMWT